MSKDYDNDNCSDLDCNERFTCDHHKIVQLSKERDVLKATLKSAYGYVKAHEYEGLTKDLLARIEELIK